MKTKRKPVVTAWVVIGERRTGLFWLKSNAEAFSKGRYPVVKLVEHDPRKEREARAVMNEVERIFRDKYMARLLMFHDLRKAVERYRGRK